MPYKAFQEDGEWCVYKLTGEGGDKTGASLGCHATLDEANDQVAALYASEDMEERGRQQVIRVTYRPKKLSHSQA